MIYFGHWSMVLNTPPPFCFNTSLMFRPFHANFLTIYCIKRVEHVVHKHSEISNKMIFLRSHYYYIIRTVIYIYENKKESTSTIYKCIVRQTNK